MGEEITYLHKEMRLVEYASCSGVHRRLSIRRPFPRAGSAQSILVELDYRPCGFWFGSHRNQAWNFGSHRSARLRSNYRDYSRRSCFPYARILGCCGLTLHYSTVFKRGDEGHLSIVVLLICCACPIAIVALLLRLLFESGHGAVAYGCPANSPLP